MTTYAYIRVSTIEQADGTSLAEQERKARGVAMIRNEEIAEVFSDAGVSGSVPLEDRPAGKRLLDLLVKGDTLIVAKLDRAFRNATDALVRSDYFKSIGVKLILVDMGNDPVTENGTGRMFFGMLALMAEFERDRILERTDNGRRAKKAKGGHTGGSAPFGFQVVGMGKDARLEPVEDQQFAIRDIIALHAEGHSLRKIADHIRVGYGFHISHEAVRRIVNEAQTAKPA
jgi:DNA invertase Pin-like site-specific DNA recombinase